MMPCKQLNEKLDDYMDGTLAETEVAVFQSHAASCESCQQTVKTAQRLRRLLKACPVPIPDAVYFDQALAKATRVSTNHQRNRWVMTGFGGAIAAGLIAWIIGGMLLKTPDLPDSDASIPGVAMTLEVPHTVNLVFSSATELDGAVLTVSLPRGVEIAGFAGQREITWITSLKAGKNILPLTLIATTPHGGELLARLEHDDRNRTFRIRVTVT